PSTTLKQLRQSRKRSRIRLGRQIPYLPCFADIRLSKRQILSPAARSALGNLLLGLLRLRTNLTYSRPNCRHNLGWIASSKRRIVILSRLQPRRNNAKSLIGRGLLLLSKSQLLLGNCVLRILCLVESAAAHQSAPLKVSGVAQTKCMSSNCPFFEKNFGTLPTD